MSLRSRPPARSPQLFLAIAAEFTEAINSCDRPTANGQRQQQRLTLRCAAVAALSGTAEALSQSRALSALVRRLLPLRKRGGSRARRSGVAHRVTKPKPVQCARQRTRTSSETLCLATSRRSTWRTWQRCERLRFSPLETRYHLEGLTGGSAHCGSLWLRCAAAPFNPTDRSNPIRSQ